jgi:viroplasmin and RNaseH domain-containing protein
MKLSLSILLLSLGIFLSACCSKKTTMQEKITLKTTPLRNGSETLSLIKNKSLDTLSKNGSLSYELKASSLTDVIQYTYEIDMDQTPVDGGLREELLFEIPQGDFELNLTDNELQNTKMLFGRQCYCRGQNGIFRITKGNLRVFSKARKINIALDFHQDNVPQKTKTISSE